MSDIVLLLNKWDQLGQHELSQEQLALMCPASVDVEQFVQNALQSGMLVEGASGGFGMGVSAINLLQNSDARITPAQAQETLSGVTSFIHQWNALAAHRRWPTIAAACVWGSCARPNAIDHGDVDVAIVWRQPQDHASAFPTINVSKALAIASLLPDDPSSWDVEDAVEDCLSSFPHLSLSGVDQWEEMSKYPQFAARILVQDQFWISADDMGKGVKSYEQAAVIQHTTPNNDGVARPAMLK